MFVALTPFSLKLINYKLHEKTIKAVAMLCRAFVKIGYQA